MSMSFTSSTTGSFSPKSPMRISPSPQRAPRKQTRSLREIATNFFIINFLSFLTKLAYPVHNPARQRPHFDMMPDHIKFSLCEEVLSSENDGSAWKERFSASAGQWVTTGGAPLLTIQTKKGPETYQRARILAQEVGELIALLQLKASKQTYQNELNREAFIISAHETQVYLSAVHVNDRYLEGCHSGHIDKDDFFVVRRSKVWNLAEPHERTEAALVILSVLAYTMSE